MHSYSNSQKLIRFIRNTSVADSYCHVIERGYKPLVNPYRRFTRLFDTARDFTLQFTVTHELVSIFTASLLLLISGFQRRAILSFLYFEISRPQLRASNSNSSQRLILINSLNDCNY